MSDVRIFGFEGMKFMNRLDGDKENAPEEDSGAGKMITEEIDKVYFGALEELATFDFASLKIVKMENIPTLADANLWNPYGAEGFDPGWKDFACIETACITPPLWHSPPTHGVGTQLLGAE